MARSATASDVFNAVAELQRRQILDLLILGEWSVNDIAAAPGIRQPQTSKHLRVLKEVGLVSVRGEGQQRLYRLNGGKTTLTLRGGSRPWPERRPATGMYPI